MMSKGTHPRAGGKVGNCDWIAGTIGNAQQARLKDVYFELRDGAQPVPGHNDALVRKVGTDAIREGT